MFVSSAYVQHKELPFHFNTLLLLISPENEVVWTKPGTTLCYNCWLVVCNYSSDHQNYVGGSHEIECISAFLSAVCDFIVDKLLPYNRKLCLTKLANILLLWYGTWALASK